MFCSNCGKQAVPGQAICANCGAALAAPGVPPAYAANPPQAAYPVYPAGYPVTPSNPGQAGYPGYAVPSRVARHVQIIGILWLIRGILSLLGWLIALPFVTGSFTQFGTRGFGVWGNLHGAPFWVPLVTAFVVAHAAFALATGYALLTRQSWGRIIAIIVAMLALLEVPFGTALGIYTLIILLPGNAAAEYAAICPRRW